MHHTLMGVLSATLFHLAGDQGHIRVQKAPHFSAKIAAILSFHSNNEHTFGAKITVSAPIRQSAAPSASAKHGLFPRACRPAPGRGIGWHTQARRGGTVETRWLLVDHPPFTGVQPCPHPPPSPFHPSIHRRLSSHPHRPGAPLRPRATRRQAPQNHRCKTHRPISEGPFAPAGERFPPRAPYQYHGTTRDHTPRMGERFGLDNHPGQKLHAPQTPTTSALWVVCSTNRVMTSGTSLQTMPTDPGAG